jgi:hypothetical protein
MEISQESATKAREFIWKNAAILGKASADKSYLEAFLKSKLSMLMKESIETTMAGKEMDAKSHPDYIALLHGIKIAQEQEVTLKWQMESAKITVEIYRTESANNRTIDRAMQ